MRKITSLFAMAVLLLCMAACERENLVPDGGVNPEFKVTATIEVPENTSRVGYSVDNDENTITPTWQVDDQIFGFDDAGNTFTYRVSEVDDGTHEATLEIVGTYTPGEASKAYAIYYPDKTVENLSAAGEGGARTLAVDISAQSGSLTTTSPILMCATADVTPGAINFTFRNQIAIIGVKAFQLPEEATITSMDLNGVVTKGTFEVADGVLKLTPGATPTKVTATGSWATTEDDGKQKCKTGVYFASLPTASADLVLDASSLTKTYANVTAITATPLAAGNYYYMSKILGERVASIGTTTYSTINEAWTAANAATEAVTIKLLNDCSASSSLVLNSSASGTGAVTLDLNGKTLTSSAQIQVNSGRSLTITDSSSDVLAAQGKIKVTTASKTHCIKINSSSFTLLGGTLENDNAATDSCYTLQLTTASGKSSTGTLTSGALKSPYRGILTSTATSTLLMNGNTQLETAKAGMYLNGPTTIGGTTSIKTTGNVAGIVLNSAGADVELKDDISVETAKGIAVYQYDGTLVINGGTYSNDNNVIYVYGTGACSVTINDGTFQTTSSGAIVYGRNSNCRVDVAGGVYKSKTSSGVLGLGSGAIGGVRGGVFFRPIPRAKAHDMSDTPYINVLNTEATTQADCPFTVVKTSEKPEQATTVKTGKTDTVAYGAVHAAAKALNATADEQELHLSANLTLTERLFLECPGTVNFYLDDHMITTSLAHAVTIRTNVNIYDGPEHLGGVTNTATQNAVVDSTTNTTLTIYGGNFKSKATYGAIRVYGNGVTLNVVGSNVLIENTGSGAALNVGGTGASTVYATISAGTLKAGSGAAIRCGYGATVITGGTFVSNTTAATTVNNSAQLTIRGGYFYTGESASDIIVKTKGSLSVFGGWYSKAVVAGVLAQNCVNDASSTTTIDERTYTHQVVLSQNKVIATVNGTAYYSFLDALNAAIEYAGPDATVTLALQDDVTGWNERINMTNTSGRPMVFDLNTHTFGVSIDSVLTTTGTLTITDESGEGTGKYLSSMRKQIYLGDCGTINITDCTIECTCEGYYMAGSTYKAIAVVGTEDQHAGSINMTNAKINCTSYFSPFHAAYGSLTFTDTEVTCGTADVGGNYCVDVFTGAVITVDNSSFLTFPRKSNGNLYGCIHSRTGRTDLGSSVVINSGWFYGGNSISSGSDNYSKPFTINGGYYNTNFAPSMSQVTYGSGLSLKSITPVQHTHGGTEYSYGYQVK